MAKFDWRKQPYYICVMIFDGFAALTAFLMNSTTTGNESDMYLVLTGLFVGLVLWSLLYLIHCSSGGQEDEDVEVGGLPLGKHVYYLAILAGCVYRLYAGYQMNHNSTGLESAYGAIWALTAPVLALYTWGNFKSYQLRKGVDAFGNAAKPTSVRKA